MCHIWIYPLWHIFFLYNPYRLDIRHQGLLHKLWAIGFFFILYLAERQRK